jgi:hypothetical protein
MEGTTSSGIGSITKPAIDAATKTARAGKVKAVKMSVKVKIKKKVKPDAD